MIRAIGSTALVGALCAMCQGCMNYLYTGSITALDSGQAERDVIVYWHKTSYLRVGRKAGPVVLLTECGRPLTFNETFNELGDSRQIAYRGMAGMDRIPGENRPLVDGTPCGELVGESSFVELAEGPVEIVIHCEPVVDDEGFGSVETYLLHRADPYVFPVTAHKKFQWLGGEIAAPAPPPCDG